MRRLACCVIVLLALVAGRASAQVRTDNGLTHVQCDSGCGGGTTDTDDGTIAGAQTGTINLSLLQLWSGAVWVRAPGDGTNGLKVQCTTGCSASAGFADNTAFTFGTTTVNPIAGVLDDVATNAATEDSAAIARITANKALHINLRSAAGTELGVAAAPVQVSLANTAANATAVKTDGSAVTQPVSGTFWPTTAGAPGSTRLSTGAAFYNALQASDTLTKVTTVDTITNPVAVTGTFWPTVVGSPLSARISDGTNFLGTSANPFIVNFPSGSSAAVSVNGYNGGSAASFGAGTSGVTTQRVVLSTDSALAANQSINIAQVNGYATTTTTGRLGVTDDALIQVLQQLLPLVTDLHNDGLHTRADREGYSLRGTFNQFIGSAGDSLKVYSTRQADPCTDTAFKISVAISQTANAVLATRLPTRAHICSFFVVGADAENVSLVEGTGTTCGTGTAAVIGGATAAAGPNFAANGGATIGNGMGTIAATAVAGNDLCLFQSGAGRVAGVLTYVKGN